MTADETPGLHHVVVNDEQQYSVWPADQAVPAGWSPVGITSTLDACLSRIDREWTDLRPHSLRAAGPVRPPVGENS
ncbi:MbtH family protein [Streptomyces rubradiris]|uniref:MbtH protein n=1 Tax=Streptomyces rubradiris TaxID=285531 RepID=A0ABQ3RL72_STRRR|nr:MbtH family NRPS accessory protein [Streptomyces rubradiris]GHH10540.1 MbtH protein [Streptomyces rubradiris]GHI56613.1 MbtH protein [Streptomyces rubradiris]